MTGQQVALVERPHFGGPAQQGQVHGLFAAGETGEGTGGEAEVGLGGGVVALEIVGGGAQQRCRPPVEGRVR